ncbi:MAG: PQQ-dependent sugar dehydrogenase [Alphaproteobacteria bacterium]|nr:PQQ-dependent sugar dehydrogenase [Alphaproteobacteria bacterium]
MHQPSKSTGGVTRRFAAALVLACLLAPAPALAQAEQGADPNLYASQKHPFRVVSVATGLRQPIALAFPESDSIIVAERGGTIRVLRKGKLDPVPLQGLPDIAVGGQGGLLDLCIHPQFERNHWVYIAFAVAGDGGLGTRIVRATLSDGRLRDHLTVLDQARSQGDQRFGGRMSFLRDETLVVALGDRGQSERAQDLLDLAGKTVRISDDGSIPGDNPFLGRPGARPEIYTFGNRSGRGLALQPGTGLLWQSEQTPRGGDEINVLHPGDNYGWPRISYGIDASGVPIGTGRIHPRMKQPRHVWAEQVTPAGMVFYDGQAFPNWVGDLFVGTMEQGMLVRLGIRGKRVVGEERLLLRALGPIPEVALGPDGYIYLLTDTREGHLFRLEPAN